MTSRQGDIVSTAEAFGEVARLLAAHEDLQQTLEKIVHLAVDHLEPCDFAGISFVEGRRITSPASSGDVPRIVDEIQAETGEGPCIDAIREQKVFETGDLAGEARWPRFSRRAHEETGVCSIMAFRLFIDGDTLGALNLYATAPDAFDDTDVALASVFAAHAAVAMQSSRREEELEHKAATRDVIGQAKGILMSRSGVDEDRAFDMLRSASQRMNIKLVRVAERIAAGQPLSGGSAPPSP
jgi:GAF domain-containing protein